MSNEENQGVAAGSVENTGAQSTENTTDTGAEGAGEAGNTSSEASQGGETANQAA